MSETAAERVARVTDAEAAFVKTLSIEQRIQRAAALISARQRQQARSDDGLGLPREAECQHGRGWKRYCAGRKPKAGRP